MSLHASPEENAANPPESWTIARVQSGSRARWELYTTPGTDYPTQSFGTKREAEEATRGGHHFDLWHKERRWYAGEKVGQWRPYAEIQAERAAIEAKRRRNAEKMGATPEGVEEWRQAVSAREPDIDELREAAGEMFELLAGRSASLIDPNYLTREEASELHRELSEAWGFASDVAEELHRTKYLGIGAHRSAVEVLEHLAQIEREAAEAVAFA